jgi:hypothetical protein
MEYGQSCISSLYREKSLFPDLKESTLPLYILKPCLTMKVGL